MARSKMLINDKPLIGRAARGRELSTITTILGKRIGERQLRYTPLQKLTYHSPLGSARRPEICLDIDIYLTLSTMLKRESNMFYGDRLLRPLSPNRFFWTASKMNSVQPTLPVNALGFLNFISERISFHSEKKAFIMFPYNVRQINKTGGKKRVLIEDNAFIPSASIRYSDSFLITGSSSKKPALSYQNTPAVERVSSDVGTCMHGKTNITLEIVDVVKKRLRPAIKTLTAPTKQNFKNLGRGFDNPDKLPLSTSEDYVTNSREDYEKHHVLRKENLISLRSYIKKNANSHPVAELKKQDAAEPVLKHRSNSLSRTEQGTNEAGLNQTTSDITRNPRMNHLEAGVNINRKDRYPQKTVQNLKLPPTPGEFDIKSIADEVYTIIARKLKIERERRGRYY